MKPSVLIIDDEQSMCDLLQTDLRLRDFLPRCVTSAKEALELFAQQEFEAVLTDLKMPGIDGIQLCSQLVQSRPDIPVVVMTAFGSLETAIAAIRAGAYDFVTKPIEMELLAMILSRAVERRRLQQQVHLLSEAVSTIGSVRGAIGRKHRDETALRSVDASRRFGGDRADHRRKRHRKRTGRPRRASALPPARRNRLSPSTAPLCPTRCWKANCSGMRKARSPMPAPTARAYSCKPRGERFCSTRSAKCRSRCKQNCCEPWRKTRFGRSAGIGKSS